MDSRVAGLQGGCFPKSLHCFGRTVQSVHGQSQIDVDGRIIRPELGRLLEHPNRTLVVSLLPQSRPEVVEGGGVLRIRLNRLAKLVRCLHQPSLIQELQALVIQAGREPSIIRLPQPHRAQQKPLYHDPVTMRHWTLVQRVLMQSTRAASVQEIAVPYRETQGEDRTCGLGPLLLVAVRGSAPES